MTTTSQLTREFDQIARAHPDYTAEEKAAARVLYAATEWAAFQCLRTARQVLAAAHQADQDRRFVALGWISPEEVTA